MKEAENERTKAEHELGEAEANERQARTRVDELQVKLKERTDAIAAAEAKLASLRSERARLVLAAADGDRAAATAAAKQREVLVGAQVEIDDAGVVAEGTRGQLEDASRVLEQHRLSTLLARLVVQRFAREAAAQAVDKALDAFAAAVKAYRGATIAHEESMRAAGFRPYGDVDHVVVGLTNARLCGLVNDTAVPSEGRSWRSREKSTSLVAHEATLVLSGCEVKGRAALDSEAAARAAA